MVVAGTVVGLFLLATARHDPSARLAVVVALVWALPNGIMGAVDDYRPMRSRTKFAIQAAAALAAAALGVRLETLAVPGLGAWDLGVLGWPFTILWLVWMANAFNFMDGLDALAAGCGMAFMVGFTLLARDAAPLGLVAAACAGGLAGFLKYNWPPARVFMGDGGSLYAGAVLGGLAVALSGGGVSGSVPFAASILLVGPFVWDATYTIAWRALRGEAMRPHKTHLFQRLAVAGWTPGRIRTIYFALTAATFAAALAYGGLGEGLRLAVLVAALAGGIALVVVARQAERHR